MGNKLITARSYVNAKRLKEYEKDGKMYATVQIPCDRCVNGVYAIGVENGHIKPHPVANGICFACGGLGYTTKEVRLYTEAEFAKMEEINEKNRQKKAAEQEQKMKVEFEANRVKWLVQNGFDENGVTYIVTGETYSRKDELKAAGFRYDSVLLWHAPKTPEGYEENVIRLCVDDVFELSAWGQYHYLTGAKDIVAKKLAATQHQENSEWIGEVGEKIKDIKIQLIRKYSFEGKFGITNVYTFKTENGDHLTWFSSTFQSVEINDWVTLKYATIKDHNEYKGVKSTVITRAKLV